MFGLVRMLFDSVYNFMFGTQEMLQFNESIEEDIDCGLAESGQQLKAENEIQVFCKNYFEEAGSVDPVKIGPENIAGIAFLLTSHTYLAHNAIEPFNLIYKSLGLESDSRNNLSLSINKKFFEPFNHKIVNEHEINSSIEDLLTSVKGPHNSLRDDLNEKLQISTNLKRKFLKLNHNQILRLQKIAQCIIQHLKLDQNNRTIKCIKYTENTSLEETLDKTKLVPRMITTKIKRSSTTNPHIFSYTKIVGLTNLLGYKQKIVSHSQTILNDFERIHDNRLNMNKNAQKRNHSTKIYITQLEPTENSIIPCKQMKFNEIETYTTEKSNIRPKSQKTKKKQKEHTKSRTNNAETVFSSKLCLSRLTLFMKTNKRYTRSKMMMDIEKELKPIKDQISILHETMMDYNVINCFYNNKGVKSSILSLQPGNRSILKSKSKLTVPSTHNTSLNGVSNIFDEYYSEIKLGPTKRSPLAEMYVKLSKY